jgi:signal transduction histidine kinase
MISNLLRSQILLLAFLLLFLASKAQISLPGYSVINYNSDNILPQNSINDMAFDSNGFLWLATEMGMVRFDGQHFREYNMANSPALYTNRCFLVNTEKGKILLEPGFATHRILTVTADYRLKEDSLLSANPYQTNRWNNCIFSYANIYKKWGLDHAVFKGLLNRLDLNGDLVTVNERQAYVRKDSSCYYLDDNTAGVHLLTEIDGHALKIQFMVGDYFFYIDRQNRLYAYKQGRWQKKISCSPGLREIFNQAESGAYPSQYTVNAIRDTSHTFLVYKGNILLLNIQNGLLDFEVLAPNTTIRNINGVIYDEVYRTLYIGTATSGLYIVKKHDFGRLFFTSDHYAINSLYAQVEVSDGSILTSSGVLNRNSELNTPRPGLYDRPALLRSSDGYIWYSNYDSLKKMDTGLRNPVTVQYLGGWLMAITEAGNKDILYCTLHKLFRRHGENTDTLLDTPALMQGAEIQVIREIYPNDLWIGTSSGLFSYDLVKGTLRHLGLQHTSVRAIYKARDGSIWIGTYGQGYYKYDRESFLKMPIDPRNNLATVHCFMEDKQGYFWLPTNKGLYRVAKKELDIYASGNKKDVFYYYFDKFSGFTSNEFNGGCTPCGIIMRDGHFSLPSLDGLIQFNPDSIHIEPPNHPIFIDRIMTDDKKVSASDQFEQRQDSGPLVFSIASPYFGNPANLHMEYSIPQLDNKWRPVNDDGKLVLTGLHKGRYTLTIRKQEYYGRYSYKTVGWVILPYWYETIWFRLLVAMAAICVLSIFFGHRYAREKKRAELLEQKVAERTQALSAINKVKETMMAVILHDLRSPLRFLHIMTVHIYENYQRASRPELAEMLLKVQHATHDLNEFTQDFMIWTNTQKEGFVVRQERIVLHEIVGGIVSLYEPATAMRKNVFLNLVPPSITLVSDPNILKLIIRNLADNANKYTMNGEIRIEAMQVASTVRIIITDTAKSMDKDLVTDILNNTYQGHNNSHGFGYKIILELLTRIQGELTIDHPGGTGNRITLAFRTGTKTSILQ